MLETTKIRREGFAIRPSFREFVERSVYFILLLLLLDSVGRAPKLQSSFSKCSVCFSEKSESANTGFVSSGKDTEAKRSIQIFINDPVTGISYGS